MYVVIMKKSAIVLIILVLLSPLSLFATRKFTNYDVGNFKISIRIPFDLSVGYYHQGAFGNNEHWAGWNSMGYKNNVEYGIELDYEYFVHSKVSLGGTLGYHFAYTLSDSVVSRVPLMFKVGYYPLQGDFEIPLVLGIGGAYLNTKGYSMVTLYLSFETGLTWFWNDNWGIGVRSGLHLIPEFRAGKPDESNLTFFVPVAVQVTFRK